MHLKAGSSGSTNPHGQTKSINHFSDSPCQKGEFASLQLKKSLILEQNQFLAGMPDWFFRGGWLVKVYSEEIMSVEGFRNVGFRVQGCRVQGLGV